MVPAPCLSTAPVPPPCYQRAVAKRGPALHMDALTLVTRLHLLAVCRLAVQHARRQCPPPLSAGPGGAPRRYRDESLLLLALLRALWRLSPRKMTAWLQAWPALALACGLPPKTDGQPWVPLPAQQWKRAAHAGAPPCEALFILAVKEALCVRLSGARDLISDSAPLTAWCRSDPDARYGLAPSHHPTPLLGSYRIPTLLCRGSGLPLLFRHAPANAHDAPFAQPLLALAIAHYGLRPRRVCQ